MPEGKIIMNKIDFGTPAEHDLSDETRKALEKIRSEGATAREAVGRQAADVAAQKRGVLQKLPQRYWNYTK